MFRPPQALAIFFAYGRFAKALSLVARIRRVPYIVIVGGWYNRISKSQRSYFDRAFRVLVHTEMQKAELVRVGYRADNIEIFPLGIDTARFSPKPAQRADWTVIGPRLLYVGRLQSSKGPLEALLAFEAVKRNFPGATLQIVGPCNDEPFRQQMIDYVHAHSLTDAVTFVGPIAYEDLPRFYQEADLFLFPSPYEGLPSVVLESMACGTPPVVLRGSGGTEEAVVDGECGWVLDMPRLAYELVEILKAPAEIRRRGEHAARRIQECYSAQRTHDILSGILEKVRPRSGQMTLARSFKAGATVAPISKSVSPRSGQKNVARSFKAGSTVASTSKSVSPRSGQKNVARSFKAGSTVAPIRSRRVSDD